MVVVLNDLHSTLTAIAIRISPDLRTFRERVGFRLSCALNLTGTLTILTRHEQGTFEIRLPIVCV